MLRVIVNSDALARFAFDELSSQDVFFELWQHDVNNNESYVFGITPNKSIIFQNVSAQFDVKFAALIDELQQMCLFYCQ